MQRQDIPHYTHDEVLLYVADAVDIANDDAVPEHLREAAFTEALRLLAAKTVQIVQPQPVGFDLGQLKNGPRL